MNPPAGPLSDTPSLTFVITTMNGAPVLPQCLESIAGLDWPRRLIDVVIIDNGSTDATPVLADEWAARSASRPDALRVRVLHLPRNIGKSAGDSLGMKEASGDWVVLLNDDTELYPDWAVRILAEARTHPEAGILGCLLLYPDRKTIQHAGGLIRPNALTDHAGCGEEDLGQYDSPLPYDYVTAACMAVRRDCVERTGLVDPGYWPIYFDEVDYCWRARKAGFQILGTSARCLHHESRTTVAYSPGFLRKYHINRLRFVALNYSPREILRWGRAEVRWARQTWRWLPLKLLAGVYLLAALRLPGWLLARRRRTAAGASR